MKKGRLPKLTPEIQKSILRDLSAGLTRECAALRNGICKRTLARWIAAGRAGKKQYLSLVSSIKRAENNAEAKSIKGIRKIAEGGIVVERRTITRTKRDGSTEDEVIEKFSQPQWQAHAWWAERKNPKQWGQQRDVIRDMKKVLAELEKERAELRRTISEASDRRVESAPEGSGDDPPRIDGAG